MREHAFTVILQKELNPGFPGKLSTKRSPSRITKKDQNMQENLPFRGWLEYKLSTLGVPRSTTNRQNRVPVTHSSLHTMWHGHFYKQRQAYMLPENTHLYIYIYTYSESRTTCPDSACFPLLILNQSHCRFFMALCWGINM